MNVYLMTYNHGHLLLLTIVNCSKFISMILLVIKRKQKKMSRNPRTPVRTAFSDLAQ